MVVEVSNPDLHHQAPDLSYSHLLLAVVLFLLSQPLKTLEIRSHHHHLKKRRTLHKNKRHHRCNVRSQEFKRGTNSKDGICYFNKVVILSYGLLNF
jgi:hypothetical protein